jgi:hypothetical protein
VTIDVRRVLHDDHPFDLHGEGTANQPLYSRRLMLFVQLPANRTLHIVAPCGVARRFAATALNRLAA